MLLKTAAIIKTWIVKVRAQLKKLYGPTSEIMDLFPLVKDRLSDEELSVLFEKRISQLEVIVQTFEALPAQIIGKAPVGRVFIGHGRYLLWRELKDFLFDRLGLYWDEFNREAVAGIATWERLSQMLSEASFAFILMTAEDEHANSTLHAREKCHS